jgi:hypothetical protein
VRCGKLSLRAHLRNALVRDTEKRHINYAKPQTNACGQPNGLQIRSWFRARPPRSSLQLSEPDDAHP